MTVDNFPMKKGDIVVIRTSEQIMPRLGKIRSFKRKGPYFTSITRHYTYEFDALIRTSFSSAITHNSCILGYYLPWEEDLNI